MSQHDPVDLPEFTLEKRIALRQRAETEQRRSEAEGKRVYTRLLVAARIREAEAKVLRLEDAAAIGRLLTGIGVTGWKRIFEWFGISAPESALERMADGARRQLARLVEQDGPGAIAFADEIAGVIKDADAPADRDGAAARIAALHKPSSPGDGGSGRWG